MTLKQEKDRSEKKTTRKKTPSSRDYKVGALMRGAIPARFDGHCPYPLCSAQGEIRAQEDMIAKGSLGWGHADCVNAKIHLHAGGGHSLCKTTSRQRTTENWSEVNCKKCLKLEAKHQQILDQEAIASFLHETLNGKIAVTIDPEGRDDLVLHWNTMYDTEVVKLTPSQIVVLREVEVEIEKTIDEVQDLNREELKTLEKGIGDRKKQVYPIKNIMRDVRSNVIRLHVRKIDLAKFKSEQLDKENKVE